ncbi:MAG: sigma 54-interacting transcriptional regulator [Tissierellia bacterium]|nr:sigma 54-interacting transcriptional regulator [Tissierellia bacterium]
MDVDGKGILINCINLDGTYDMTQLYKLVLDLTRTQVTVADGKGVFRFINKACEEYFGVKEEDMINHSGFELEKNGVFDISATAEVVRTNDRVRFIQKTGSGKILLVTGYPIYNQQGERISIINISADITETETLKKELEESQNLLSWYKNEVRLREYSDTQIHSTNNPKMLKIYETLRRVANTDILITFLGKTGVGKSYLANYVHNISERKDDSFITINCSAIPENLLESELFGYVKGAFTGASNKGKIGIFELAKNGTVFLDEIGDLPMGLQAKLLYAIEEKKFMKIGDTKETVFNARLIVATNKDLVQMVDDGSFRDDLFYRLNVLPIDIPPLNERKEDLPQIIKRLEVEINEKYKTFKIFDESAYDSLMSYDYPGNLRELRNLIERSIITSVENIISGKNITPLLRKNTTNSNSLTDEIVPMRVAVERTEKKLLELAKEKYGSTRKMAEVLELDQSTIVKKQKKYFE